MKNTFFFIMSGVLIFSHIPANGMCVKKYSIPLALSIITGTTYFAFVNYIDRKYNKKPVDSMDKQKDENRIFDSEKIKGVIFFALLGGAIGCGALGFTKKIIGMFEKIGVNRNNLIDSFLHKYRFGNYHLIRDF